MSIALFFTSQTMRISTATLSDNIQTDTSAVYKSPTDTSLVINANYVSATTTATTVQSSTVRCIGCNTNAINCGLLTPSFHIHPTHYLIKFFIGDTSVFDCSAAVENGCLHVTGIGITNKKKFKPLYINILEHKNCIHKFNCSVAKGATH